jgi:hypothetical protein
MQKEFTMKISEHKQTESWLTKPSNKTATANINNKPLNKISSGVKALAKSKAMAKYIREPIVRNVDFGLSDPVAYVNEIKDVYQHNPDVYEINDELNKFRASNDQLPTYKDVNLNNTTGKFKNKKTGKSAALSSVADEKIFEPILDRLKKPKAKSQVKLDLDLPTSTDFFKNIEDIKQMKRESDLAELRFRENIKPKYDPDEHAGIAYLLGVNKKGEL